MRSLDINRNRHVTQFNCAECGAELNLTYEESGVEMPSKEQPTGACMVKNIIYIYPCKKCIEPAKKIMQAVKTLMEQGDTK